VKSRAKGFTLLEILVAFVVFALAFGVVLELLSSSLNQTRRAREFTQAALWAKSMMDSVGVEEKLEEGRDAGEFDKTYSYELEISEYQLPSETPPQAGLYQPLQTFKVHLKVSWAGRSADFYTLKMTQRELANGGAG
jgi:general secretion pathway protein I